MNMRLFRRQPDPIASDAAARRLQELACLSTRERFRARARMMREDMGLEPSPYLEPRA